MQELDPVDELSSFDEDYGSDDNFVDDFEVEDDYGPASAPPARRRSSGGGSSGGRGRKRPSKRRSKKKSSNGRLYIIGSVTALALLILLLFLFWPSGDGGGNAIAQQEERNKIDLSWLPPDVELVVHAKVNDVWNAALIREIAEDPENAPQVQKLEQQFEQEFGYSISTITSMTFGLSGLTDAQKKQKEILGDIDMSNPQEILANQEKLMAQQQEIQKLQHMVLVVRSSEDLDEETLMKSLDPKPERVEQDGSHYYVRAAGDFGQPTGFHLADSKTLLIAGESDLIDAIKRGSKETRRKEFDFVDADQHMLVAIVPKDPTIFDDDNDVKSRLPPSVKSMMPESLLNSKKSNFNAFSIGLAVSSKVDLQLRGNFKGETEATEAKDDFDTAVTELNSKLSESEAKMSEQFPNIMKVAREFVDSLAANQSGSILDITATIPSDIKATKDEFPALVMQLMFGGGGMPFGAQPGQTGPPSLDPGKLPPGVVPNPGGANKKAQ